MVEPFEEIVKELEKKYRVKVDAAVTRKIGRVVGGKVRDLVEGGKCRTLRDIRGFFKVYYKKLWCWRPPLKSVDGLIVRTAKKGGVEFSSKVREELNRLFASLSGDTLYAAAAYVVLTRGRKRNPENPTITMNDVEAVCKDFLGMTKPEWMC